MERVLASFSSTSPRTHNPFCTINFPKFSSDPPFALTTRYFRLYSDYLNGYDAALNTLVEFKSRPDFAQFLVEQAAKPECTLKNIENYLILPVQRVPRYSSSRIFFWNCLLCAVAYLHSSAPFAQQRYKLLLESLVASTVETHEEFKRWYVASGILFFFAKDHPF